MAFTSMNTLTLLIELGVVCLGRIFVSCPKVLAMSRKADFYRDNGAFTSPSESFGIPKTERVLGSTMVLPSPRLSLCHEMLACTAAKTLSSHGTVEENILGLPVTVVLACTTGVVTFLVSK